MGLYLFITFGTEVNPSVLARYKMDVFQYQLLRASFVIPLMLAWFAALYGFSHIVRYAKKIEKSRDGEGFAWVAGGLTVLALGLPLNSIISTAISRSVAVDLIEQSTATIITTHLSVGYQMVSFILIAIGAWKLLKIVKITKLPIKSLIVSNAVLVVISGFYIFAALNNPSREVAVAPAQTATYYMNDWLIFATIIMPYIITWAAGLFAFLAIRSYHHHVNGVIYKKSLKKLNTGMAIIILTSIALQFLTAAVTAVYAWQLGALVILLQLFVFAIGYGYLCVARGAKGLTKLEEVK